MPKNVLMIVADDWSPIAGCYGNPVIRTPRIDQFATEGTVFDAAFCGSPSCAVSRATLLTGLHSHGHGQYGHSHGIHGFRTRTDVASLPALLGTAGYRTACIGKRHFEPESVYPFDLYASNNPSSVRELQQTTAHFLESCGSNPFFAMVAPIQPHRSGRGFGNERHRDDFPAVHYDPADVIVPPFLPDLPEVRADLADYYEAVSRYDHVVGQILDTLDASGHRDDTLVFVMTDHGMPFPGAKASNFDTGHRCPLIARCPGVQPHLRSSALVSWVDLAPTILAWCGLPDAQWPAGLHGRSMLDILGAPEPAGWDRTFYSHCFHEVTNYFPYRVLRERRYKLVRNLAWEQTMPLPSDLFRSRTWTAVREQNVTRLGERSRHRTLHHDREALYDMGQDPMETVNLIDTPDLAGKVEAMRRELMAWRTETNDPWLEVSSQEGESGAPAL